jgi:hypothetical protein
LVWLKKYNLIIILVFWIDRIFKMYRFDFRRKVLEIREAEALSMASVAARFGVGALSVMRWTRKLHPCLRRNKPGAKIDRQALCEDVIARFI